MDKDLVLFDFSSQEQVRDWGIVNDGVMGGLSRSEIYITESSTAVFQGDVSLENDGGFSSTRTSVGSRSLEGYAGIQVRFMGDGKRYQCRFRTDPRFDGISYRYHFSTEGETWSTVTIPFRECEPVLRGRVLEEVGPLSAEQVTQLGFLISDKQEGPFRLEIDWIRAVL